MKMFLALAILLAIAEIVITGNWKGRPSCLRTDTFCYVLCSCLHRAENRKIKRIILYIVRFLHLFHLHSISRNYSPTGDLILIA